MRSVALLALIVFTASGAAGCLADAPDDPAGERSDVSESALSTVRPEQPVTKAVSIKLRMTSSEGNLERLYLPVIKNGTLEHIIVDSGTSRTWFRLAGATQTWTDNAFVATIGGQPTSIWGRNVPAFNEFVNGRVVIGVVGNDLLTSGPTKLDLQNGTMTRFPKGAEVPNTSSWPTMPIELNRGVLLAKAEIDGVPRHLQLDTGAPTTILITEPLPGDIPRKSHDVLGNEFTVFDGVGTVQLNPSIIYPDVPITRAPSFPHFTHDVAEALGIALDGILGLSSLGHRSVIIDAEHGVLRLQPEQKEEPNGGGTCAHDPCKAGGALKKDCSAAVTQVCLADSFCCGSSWDSICVREARDIGGLSCQ
jgi:hypothetical protein